MQIGIGALNGPTTGASESRHDFGEPGKFQEISLRTQGGARKAKCYLDKSQKRQQDKTLVIYLWKV